MTEVQLTRWQGIPSMVTARDGDEVVKISLPSRFQEAIDEAAMRAGETDADAYLAGWARDPWVAAEGTPAEAAATLTQALEDEWDQGRLDEHVSDYGGGR